MEEKTNQTQSAVFNYTAPRAVRIGDVFYRIESGESVYFREPCKVCDGTGQLTVRGVTFKCPCCDTQKEVISIHKYVVRRYRVYKITQEAGTSEWKPCDYKDVTFSLYRKVGHGFCVYGGGGHIEFSDRKFAQNYNLPLNGDIARGERGIYDDYNLAVKIADQMNALELKRLAEYNKEYGTAHEAMFKAKNDPKSN